MPRDSTTDTRSRDNEIAIASGTRVFFSRRCTMLKITCTFRNGNYYFIYKTSD